MKKRILLIEDDDFVRESLKMNLIDFGFEAVEAKNGFEAQDIFKAQKFDAVISDINMPKMTGIEFLSWLRLEKHFTPVVLITGFANLFETKEALEHGANDFLPKPFSRQELKNVLDRLLDSQASLDSGQSPQSGYCRLNIDHFIAAKTIDYPIYIRIGDTRYLKIAHQGGKIEASQAARYKSQNIDHLWVRKDDLKKVLQFNIVVAKALTQNSSVPVEKRLTFLKFTAETLADQIYVDGAVKENFEQAREFVSLNLEMLAQNDDLFELLEALQEKSDFFGAHSLGVSLYSVMLANITGWTSPQNLLKVGMSGLFHDIGLKEIDVSIVECDRTKLSPSDRKILSSHTLRGRDILLQNRNIPSEVAEVAYQHHEASDGTGYPQKLTEHYIHPLAKIVAIADAFCELTIRYYPDQDLKSAFEAIEIMEGRSNEFNRVLLNKFFTLFKAA